MHSGLTRDWFHCWLSHWTASTWLAQAAILCGTVAVAWTRKLADFAYTSPAYTGQYHHPTSIEMARWVWQEKAPVPQLYRILVPYVMGFASNVTGLPFEVTYWLFFMMIVATSGLVFFHYLKTWVSEESALTGVFMLFTYSSFYFSEWEYGLAYLELTIFCVGILAIERHAHPLFFLLLVIGSLNRETAGGLVLLYLCRWIGVLPWSVLLGICGSGTIVWLIIFFGVRTRVGNGPLVHADIIQLSHNTRWILDSLVHLTPFHHYRFIPTILAVPVLAVVLRWKATPVALRRMVWFAPVFIVIILVTARFGEARLTAPLIPLLFPFFLRAVETERLVETR